LSKAPALARNNKSSTKSPIAVAGRGVWSWLDEKIPKGMFLMEKWLSFGTGMYDITVFERDEKARRLIAGGGRIRELEASGDGFIVGRGEGISKLQCGDPGDRVSTARVSRFG
jgi:hypothetical protein